MVRFLATVLSAALLSSSTFAAPTRGIHRRTITGDQPATAIVPEPPVISEPPVLSEPPVPSEPPVSGEPPVPSELPVSGEPPVPSEPPVSSEPPVPSEPPASGEPPVPSEPPVSGEPPVPSEPPVSGEPPLSSSIAEPPQSTPITDGQPPSTSITDVPPTSTPLIGEPPLSQPPVDQPPKPVPTHGSGSNPWSPTYDDCVQKCIAEYGAPPQATWTPPPKEEKVPGAKPTHTVMVAPVDGVPRFMPFTLNATVGDTVRYIWTGTNDHSVTMSSELSVCNKSQSADAFDSGIMSGADGEKTFDVEVKTDQPMWFYSSFGDNCGKGMFGAINPKSAFGDQESVGAMMGKWVESNPDLQAAWTFVQNKTAVTPAEKWGNSMSVAGIPEDKYLEVAQNILWTKVNLAENPGMQQMGSAQTPDNSPLRLSGDLSTLLAESNAPQVIQEPAAVSSAPAAQLTESQPSGALPSYSSAAVVSVLALLASVLVM